MYGVPVWYCAVYVIALLLIFVGIPVVDRWERRRGK